MLLFKILQEKLLNFLLFFSIIFLWIILSMDNPVATQYEIIKNILYSMIASIIFYYINVIYPKAIKDKKYRSLFISKYKQMKLHITAHVVFILNEDDIDVFFKYFPNSNEPINPVMLRYFFYGKRYYDFDITGDHLQHPETDKENLEAILAEVIVFNRFFQNNKHNIHLSEIAENTFNELDRLTLEVANKKQYIHLLISNILLAENFSQEKNLNEDIFLHYLDEKNYTDKKYNYIKTYLLIAYLTFWCIFSINTFHAM